MKRGHEARCHVVLEDAQQKSDRARVSRLWVAPYRAAEIPVLSGFGDKEVDATGVDGISDPRTKAIARDFDLLSSFGEIGQPGRAFQTFVRFEIVGNVRRPCRPAPWAGRGREEEADGLACGSGTLVTVAGMPTRRSGGKSTTPVIPTFHHS
jgi:hypothetical protein